MLCIAAVFFTLASAQAEDEMGTMNLSKAKIAKVATYIAKTQKSEKSVEEITILATDKDGNVSKIASTTASEVGKAADPEDIDAIIDNKVVSIVEGDSIDVTVPIANAGGMPAAIAGVTLSLKDGMSKKDAEAKAVAIGQKVDAILIK
jgi:hypothetical protein